MATQTQIEANRRNAQKSTGPRSAEGKAASRLNALKCGIDAQAHVIPGEDPDALEELALEYHQRFKPGTPEQRMMVDAMINSEWLLRRFRKVEAELWTFRLRKSYKPDRKNPLGDIYGRSVEIFGRLQRRIDSIERTYRRSLAELRRLQSEPAPTPDPPQPSEAAHELRATVVEIPFPAQATASQDQQLAPEIGFVPSTRSERPAFRKSRDSHGAAPSPSVLRHPQQPDGTSAANALALHCEPRR
jgi:hypothetical protein